MMTLREVFDTVKAHLLAQGCKATSGGIEGPGDGSPGCAYRGDNGTKCAAGVLIKDEFYRPELEGKPAGHGDVIDALLNSGVPPQALSSYGRTPLVLKLQTIHDWKPEALWPEYLDAVERDYFGGAL